MANGSHSFSCKAHDATGRSTNSAIVSVTVNNPPPSGTPGQLQWLHAPAIATPGSAASANGLATDHAGNVIVVGALAGSIDFGGGNVVTSIGSADIFIAKYSAQGVLQWVKRLGTALSNTAHGVAVDSQNNIIVTGDFSSSVDFGGGLVTSFGGQNIFVVKYSSSGGYIWAKGFGAGGDHGYAVAVDGSDNVVLGAATGGSLNFGGVALINLGSYDGVIAKLSAATGATMWAKEVGGSGTDYVFGLAVDRSGDVVATGQFGGGNLGGGNMAGGGFVAKYSGTNGSYRWAKVASASSGAPSGNAVATDPNTGNIFVTGGFSGSADFGGGPISTLYGGGLFVAAYGPTGSNLWARAFGASGDAGAGVAIDGNGNLAITGTCNTGADFTGTGVMTYGAYFFVASFTPSSSYRWVVRTQTTTTGGGGTGITADSLGHVTTCGSFKGTADFGGIAVTGSPWYVSPFIGQYDQ